MNRTLKIICACLVAIIVLIFAGFFALSMLMAFAIDPPSVTDLRQYDKVLAEWSESGLIKEFPHKIPANAQKVRMASKRRGFSQADSYLQLRMQVPLSEIIAIDKKYSGLAIHKARGENINTSDSPLPVPIGYSKVTKDIDGHSLFMFYILMALDQGGKDYAWNHGKSYGVAVSRERSEVIYWCESW